MKKLLFILSMFAAFAAHGQTYQTYSQYGAEWNRIWVKTVFSIPNDTVPPPTTANKDYKQEPALAMKNNLLYFWSVPLQKYVEFVAGSSAWLLGGNSGTDSDVQFVGTTDNEDFVIKANGIEWMRIKADGKVQFKDTLQTNNLSVLPLYEPDYEIVVFPDIQNMIRYAQADSRTMFKWLQDSAAYYNVKAMLQVGDLTDWNTQAEWDTLAAQMSLIPTSLPTLVVPGNHDYGNGFNPAGRDATRYKATISAFNSGKTYYKGNYNSSDENYFITFTAGTKKYAAIGLEFIPTDGALYWAGHIMDSLYAAEPERECIVVTHAYINVYGEIANDTAVYSKNTYGMTGNSGQDMWDKVLKKKKNLKWIFNGHFLIPNAWPQVGLMDQIIATGEKGNLVTQMFVNYQDDANHGDGYFMRLRFSPSTGEVGVRYYSSLYNADDPRVSRDTLQSPTLSITTSVGVKGTLSVGQDVRVAGELKVESLEKGGVGFIFEDRKLTTSQRLRYDPVVDSFTVGIVRINKHVLGSNTRAYMSVRDSNDVVVYEQRAQLGSTFLGLRAGSKYNIYDPLYYTEPSIGIGLDALANAIGGHRLIGIGYRSLYSLTGSTFPSATVAIGTSSGDQATSVTDAVIVGNNGAAQATSISYSDLTGSDVAYSAGTINGATINGTGAARQVTGSGIDSTTAIGLRAIRNVTSAKRGVFLGANVARDETNVDDQLWISNSATSSPLVKGHFVNGTLGTPGQFGVGTYTPNASAKVEITSTTQGVLVPRMTGVQQAAIGTPATGLMIYNTDSAAFCYYNGSIWQKFGAGGGAGTPQGFEDVLTVDPDLTSNQVINLNNNSLAIDSALGFNISSATNTNGRALLMMDGNLGTRLFSQYHGIRWSGLSVTPNQGVAMSDRNDAEDSTAFVSARYDIGVTINHDEGFINIPNIISGPGTKAVRWNGATGNLELADTTISSGGPSVGTYSTRVGLSPSNGDEFFQTDDGRDAPAGKYYYLNSAWNYININEEALPRLFSDFKTVGYANAQVNEDVSYGLGNGGGTYYGTGSGVVTFSTGTATNGFAGVYQGYIGQQSGWLIMASGVCYYKVRINIPTLSTGTEEYNINAGIQDGYGGEPQNGIYIFYDRPTSTNWLLKASQFTTKATTTSGVAVTTGWHTLEILVNAAGTSAEAWVDGTSLGTISSNIPVSGSQLSAQSTIAKTAGTTSRSFEIDYIKAWQRLTTPRN